MDEKMNSVVGCRYRSKQWAAILEFRDVRRRFRRPREPETGCGSRIRHSAKAGIAPTQ